MFLPVGDNVEKRSIPVIGTFLILANVLVYAYEWRLFEDSPRDGRLWIEFIQEWGLVPYRLRHGEWQQLFSSMFLHGDFFHLLGNMIVLWAFVRSMEDAMGSVTFLFFYVIWGVAAGVAHSAQNWESNAPMIGASGAIAGLIGAYFVVFGARTKIKTLFFFAFRPWVVNVSPVLYVGVWLLLQVAGNVEESENGNTGVAWMAHLGGFAIGAVSMWICGGNLKRKLVRTADGVLEFRDAQAPANDDAGVGEAIHAPIDEPVAANLAERCQYCGAELAPECRISENMVQCPSPDCGRLTMLGF